MASKPTEKAAGTIITRIGVLSGGEVIALETVGREMYLTIRGAKIARRGLSAKSGVRTWVAVSPAWLVTDVKDPMRKIEIRHNGRLLDWTLL